MWRTGLNRTAELLILPWSRARGYFRGCFRVFADTNSQCRWMTSSERGRDTNQLAESQLVSADCAKLSQSSRIRSIASNTLWFPRCRNRLA
jgi:hypothetical protein